MKTIRIYALIFLALMGGILAVGCAALSPEAKSVEDPQKDPSKNHDPAIFLPDKNDK